jgi:hypothetical protein
MEVTQHQNGSITITQKKYIVDLLKRFKMEHCNPAITLILKTTEDNNLPLEDNLEYQALVGSLIYLSVVTRPDIAYAVSIISQNMKCPTQQDWTAAKRVLRYIKGTNGLGITYHKIENPQLTLIGEH